jgi:WD40 repeat protein
MLDQLPTETIHQIASFLPTASSIIRFSLTNRKLHAQISGDDYATFRSFVQKNFPTIRTPPAPYWKEAAYILTTRSRAWDRRAFVAKALEPPADRLNPLYYGRARGPSIGYAPVIDSYETWHGSSWAERREVLVWGAAGRLMMRASDQDFIVWHAHRVHDDHLPEKDILNVRLLRPNQKEAGKGEVVVIRRANDEITKLEFDFDDNEIHNRTLFDTAGLATEGMDVSYGCRPLVAACNRQHIQLFDGNAHEQINQPISILKIQQNHAYKHRTRCAKFINNERLAVGVQYLEGRSTAPMNIYRITPEGSSSSPESCLPSSSGHTSVSGRNRTNANAIAPLDDVSSLCGRAGEVFLSGWSDGIVRLYDIRTPTHSSSEFHDGVDDGQILSLLPIGHERFLAGGVQNACLKTFDLRMPGAKVYSHQDAGFSPSSAIPSSGHGAPSAKPPSSRDRGPVDEAVNRQLNIFLAIRVQCPMRLWQPLPDQRFSHLPRYRGPVYSLSAPSPTSPTVYAGVENHVIQLDFVSTDDMQRDGQDAPSSSLVRKKGSQEQILNLSCYERPRTGHESTDPVLLRYQVNWNTPRLEDGLTEDGWDERWRLASWERRSASWRMNHLAL